MFVSDTERIKGNRARIKQHIWSVKSSKGLCMGTGNCHCGLVHHTLLTPPQEAWMMPWWLMENWRGRWNEKIVWNRILMDIVILEHFHFHGQKKWKQPIFVSLKAQPIFTISTTCNFKNNIVQCPKILFGTYLVQRASFLTKNIFVV